MGWLAAKPESWPKNRRATMLANGKPLGLPKIEAGGYLVDAMYEAGPITADAMGNRRPLDWPVLSAFANIPDPLVKHRWELTALRRMSAAYLRGLTAGEDGLSKHPNDWKPE